MGCDPTDERFPVFDFYYYGPNMMSPLRLQTLCTPRMPALCAISYYRRPIEVLEINL